MEKEELLKYWITNKIVSDPRVLNAFRKIPRENFVRKEDIYRAYEDIPLPILQDQTISQPTTVMLMTEALALQPGIKVLEIGSGSGYQSAIIAEIIKPGKVISLEIIPELVEFARKNLMKSKITNVNIFLADGSLGYSKEAPYDRIIVTAASPIMPKQLVKQLKKDGILLSPVGSPFSQKMIRITKLNGKLKEEDLGDFVFVPLKGKYGYY